MDTVNSQFCYTTGIDHINKGVHRMNNYSLKVISSLEFMIMINLSWWSCGALFLIGSNCNGSCACRVS